MNYCSRTNVNRISRSEAPVAQDVPVVSNVSDVQRLFDEHYGATILDNLSARILQKVFSALKFYQCNNHLQGPRNDNDVGGQGPTSPAFHRGVTNLTNHGKSFNPRPDIAPHYNDVPYVNPGSESRILRFMEMIRDNVFIRYGGKIQDWTKVKAHGFLYHSPSGMGSHRDSSSPLDKEYVVPRLVLSMGSTRDITYTIHEFTKDTNRNLGKAVSQGMVRPTSRGAHAYICHPWACGKSAIAWKDAEHSTGYVVAHEVSKLSGHDSSVNLIFDLPLTQAGTMSLINDMNTGQFSLLSVAAQVESHPLSEDAIQGIESWAQTLCFVPLPDTVMCQECNSSPAYTYTKPAESGSPNSHVLTHCVKCACRARSENPSMEFLAHPCSQLCGEEKYRDRSFCRKCIAQVASKRKCDDCPAIGCVSERNYCLDCIMIRSLATAAQKRCVECGRVGVHVDSIWIHSRCSSCHNRQRSIGRVEKETRKGTLPMCRKCGEDFAISRRSGGARMYCGRCWNLCSRKECFEPRNPNHGASAASYCSYRCKIFTEKKNVKKIPICKKCTTKPTMNGRGQRFCAECKKLCAAPGCGNSRRIGYQSYCSKKCSKWNAAKK